MRDVTIPQSNSPDPKEVPFGSLMKALSRVEVCPKYHFIFV